MSGVDTGLAHPADFERNESTEERFGLIHVGSNVVINKEKMSGFLMRRISPRISSTRLQKSSSS